ncbi:hypothetical protein NKH69_05710 [Mesorhizobium sp. M0976]|uniref:hypothetical protein n=1 Tax=Mesorhizobium sp. M0976 TaxID=2957038 RepID=UPI00333CFD75
MAEDKENHERLKKLLAQSLANETGITEAQARELIEMIGTDHGSLLREGRMLKSRQGPAEKPITPR